MLLSEFDYNLPENLIAQTPLEKRDESKLLVLDKNNGFISHDIFYNIINYINKDDLVIFNDTKVSAYRLYGHKHTGAKIECLLTHKIKNNVFQSLVNPGKKLQIGTEFELDCGLNAKVIDILKTGERVLEFLSDTPVDEIIKTQGTVPLPPYIHKTLDDYGRYQTVYAENNGSVAAPTAGLHFTDELLNKLKEKVDVAYITLHVGIATFRPIKVNNIDDHIMHTEKYIISEETKNKIKNCKGRIIAVGTTTTRALETAANAYRDLRAEEAESSLFIKPGYDFKIVDALITNFHIPKSTLLLLVSALSKKDYIMHAYEEAIKKEYRFFSFGDAMFIN